MIARLLSIVAAAVLTAGCHEQKYTIRVSNEGDEPLSDVRVWYGEVMTGFGYLSKSVYKANDLIRHPPADIAEVSWVDSGGQSYRVPVDISGLVPDNYDQGVLTFEIHADKTVTAGFFIPKKLPFEPTDG